MNKKESDSALLPHGLPVAGWGHALAFVGRMEPGAGQSLSAALTALPANAVHEVYAARGDTAVMTGFGVMLALMLAADKPCFFVRVQSRDGAMLYPPGLAVLGLDPARCFTVHAPDLLAALRATADIARSGAAGAVLVEVEGNPRLMNLTASRRLALAAEKSATAVLLLRPGAQEAPSAAYSRWHIEPALSTPLLAEAPGGPAFAVTLLRHRRMAAGQRAQLIWNVDHGQFEEKGRATRAAASGGASALAARRTADPRASRAA
jgi:protein ImuA